VTPEQQRDVFVVGADIESDWVDLRLGDSLLAQAAEGACDLNILTLDLYLERL